VAVFAKIFFDWGKRRIVFWKSGWLPRAFGRGCLCKYGIDRLNVWIDFGAARVGVLVTKEVIDWPRSFGGTSLANMILID
jgi:hypothetical protein